VWHDLDLVLAANGRHDRPNRGIGECRVHVSGPGLCAGSDVAGRGVFDRDEAGDLD